MLITLMSSLGFSDAGFSSLGAQGHGPVRLLLISAADLGFAWDGAE